MEKVRDGHAGSQAQANEKQGMRAEGIPTPGCFVQRVRNRLKIKELCFWSAQKSAQESEKKGLESRGERQVKRCEVDGRPPTPLFFVSVASKGLSQAVSLLFATLVGRSISVAAKELTLP